MRQSAWSADTITCGSIDLVANLSSALLRKRGVEVTGLVTAIRPTFSHQTLILARVSHWFGEGKGLPQVSRSLRMFSPGIPVGVEPKVICGPKLITAAIPVLSYTQRRFTPRLVKTL